MTPGRRWGLAIVGMLAVNVLATVGLATLARVGHSEVIPDYYAKAARYDATLDEQAASRALGWHVELTLDHGEASVLASDAAGRPITDAQVTVTGYPRADAGRHVDVALTPTPEGGGRYRGLADHAAGVHDLTVTIVRGGSRFVRGYVVTAR